MNRILFVDDEPSVLNGLRNALRRERQRWDMVFVNSGDEALDEMAKGPFDLIISDMRMPGMDGAELLEQVRRRYPQTVRILLSGHADPTAMLRALPVAQQFLAKPCAADDLAAIIERCCELRRVLDHPVTRRRVGEVDHLPSAPAVYQSLRQAMSCPKLQIATVVAILEQDPAMCAKILQLVNSSYFGLARPITSLREALVHLGLDLVSALTLSAHVFSALERGGATGQCLERRRQHSCRLAQLARRFVGPGKAGDEAFAVALVHDVGAIVLSMAASDVEDRLMANTLCVSDHDAEIAVFGVSHAEVGAYLLGTWGLPMVMVEALAYHHRPSQMKGSSRLVAALHVADRLSRDGSSRDADPLHGLDHAYLERAGVAAELPLWIDIARAPATATASTTASA